MSKVQRDLFDCSPEEWLAARDALINLFESDDVASSKVTRTEAFKSTDNLLESADEGPTKLHAFHSDHTDASATHLGSQATERLALLKLDETFKLSIIVPVFNETETIEQVLQRLVKLPLPLEIIVVDDGSKDGSRELLTTLVPQVAKELPARKTIELALHSSNFGKGAALKTGFAKASGTVIAIQDADLEYDPTDFIWLLGPLVMDQADVVYGSRFSRGSLADSPFWHRWGNQLITFASNLTTGLDWRDVETCYKLIRASVIQEIGPTLKERGFGIELELTAKLARYPKLKYYERPIRYQKRGYSEGKKIGLKDAFWAAWCILRYRLGN